MCLCGEAGSSRSSSNTFPRQNIFQFKVESQGRRTRRPIAQRRVSTLENSSPLAGRKGGRRRKNRKFKFNSPDHQLRMGCSYKVTGCIAIVCRAVCCCCHRLRVLTFFSLAPLFFFVFLLNLIKRHSWPLSAADDSTDSEVTAADGPGRPPHDLPLSGRETRPAEMANDNPLGNVVKIIFITSTTKEIGDQVARQKPCQLQLAVHLWRTWRNTIASSS